MAFKGCGLRLAVSSCLGVVSVIALAQTKSAPPAPAAKAGIELYNTQRPAINYSDTSRLSTTEEMLNPYNAQAPYNPYAPEVAPSAPPTLYNPYAPYIPGQEPKNDEPAALSRLSGGVALGMTNVGLIHSLIKQGNDSVYKKNNASEFGFGVSGFLDFAIPGNPGALRIRAGASRLTVKPNSAVKGAYTSSQLENSETLFNVSGMFRLSAPPEVAGGIGVFWGGIGAQMIYVLSTHRFDSSGAQTGGSKLANSYGYTPFATIGAEIPFTTKEDFSISVDWLPWRGFNVIAGLKTAL